MQGPAVSGVVGQTSTVTDVESNTLVSPPTIFPIPTPSPIATASDNLTVVTVDDTVIPSKATLVGAGVANVTRLDRNNGLSSTTVFTVTAGAGVPNDLTSTWGNPASRR